MGLRRVLAAQLNVSLMTRRELLAMFAVAGVRPSLARAFPNLSAEFHGGWEKYSGNPVLGGQYGTCFDICVLGEQGLYRMWVSWRPKKSVALTESKDGINWRAPEIV